jgi:hypothetical protein
LIVAAGLPSRRIVKLDAATGDVLWVSQDNTLAQFATARSR